MLKDQLVSRCSGLILDAVRDRRGRLSFVSAEARVNRKYFNSKNFQTLKFFRLVRVLYCLAMDMDREEFCRIGTSIFEDIWDTADALGYELLDERRE